MRIAHTIALVFVAGSSAVFAQSAPTDIAKPAVRAGNVARPTVDQLCAKLTLEKVQAVMGKNFQRREQGEALYRECKYGDSKEKGSMPVRYFSLGSYSFASKEAGWRKEIEGNGKGKVTTRDGVLVGDRRGDGFNTFDTIWFKDRSGQPLYITVNKGVSEDQAVALAKAAMN